MSSGDTFTWSADGSQTGRGWRICECDSTYGCGAQQSFNDDDWYYYYDDDDDDSGVNVAAIVVPIVFVVGCVLMCVLKCAATKQQGNHLNLSGGTEMSSSVGKPVFAQHGMSESVSISPAFNKVKRGTGTYI